MLVVDSSLLKPICSIFPLSFMCSGIARKVGGFRTKLEAAYSDKEHAIKTVFAPEENMQDPTDAKVVAEYKGKGLKVREMGEVFR